MLESPQTWDQQRQSDLRSPGLAGTMLTARLARVISGNMSYNYTRSPEWLALKTNPSIEAFLENGFDYVYFGADWWNRLPAAPQRLSRAVFRP
jgi:hypothetical protein